MTQDIQTGTTPDPFNPAALRLDPSYGETVGVRRHLTTVPVRKPNRQEFFRVHPDAAFRLRLLSSSRRTAKLPDYASDSTATP